VTRYEQIGRRAIEKELAGRSEPVSLWSLSCSADQAVRTAGKAKDLYYSLYDYENLLPADWTCRWLTVQGGTGDGMLMAVPRSWRSGESQNNASALLGRGTLVEYTL